MEHTGVDHRIRQNLESESHLRGYFNPQSLFIFLFSLSSTLYFDFVDLNFIPCQFGLCMQYLEELFPYKGSAPNRENKEKRKLTEHLKLANHSFKLFICINSQLSQYSQLSKLILTSFAVLYLYVFCFLCSIYYKISNIPHRNCRKMFRENYKSFIIYGLDIITKASIHFSHRGLSF